MDKLWAPWRIKYLEVKKSKKCIFCLGKNDKCRDFVVFRTAASICMLNIFPYNNGHVMVSPKRHKSDLTQLSNKEILDLFSAVNRVKKLLDKVLKPEGYNIGINIGAASGAGVKGHLHVHIVPRWWGDTNFMPVLNDTKVISQSLEELCSRLKDADAKAD